MDYMNRYEKLQQTCNKMNMGKMNPNQKVEQICNKMNMEKNGITFTGVGLDGPATVAGGGDGL